MNTLNLHILYLTGRHDCVIVPGFGAFIVERVPARIDSDCLTVYGPETRIGFNSELTDDDGLLIHSISRRSKSTHQEARRIVEHTVQVLKERLSEGETVEFENIGSFSLSPEGRKIFTPLRNPSTPVYTLPLLMSGKMKDEGLERFVPEVRATQEVSAPSSPEVITGQSEEDKSSYDKSVSRIEDIRDGEGESPVKEETDRRRFNTRRNYYIPVNKVFARVACLLIVLACSFLILTRESDRNVGEIQKASIVPVETLMNIKTSGDTIEKPAKVGRDETERVSSVERLPYHLIVATFLTREEAERYIAESEDDTTSMTPIKGNGSHWRVAIASGTDRSELQKELNQASRRFEGAWIWERIMK